MFWIKIEEQRSGRTVWEGELDDNFSLRGDKKARLAPEEVYLLHIASRGEKGIAWQPEERDDLLLLQIDYDPDDKFFKLPEGYSHYAIKIRFQVDNDGIFSKIIRWRFKNVQRERSAGLPEFSVWRLPLFVRPRLSRVLYVALSFPIAAAASEIYEYFFSESNFTFKICPPPSEIKGELCNLFLRHLAGISIFFIIILIVIVAFYKLPKNKL